MLQTRKRDFRCPFLVGAEALETYPSFCFVDHAPRADNCRFNLSRKGMRDLGNAACKFQHDFSLTATGEEESVSGHMFFALQVYTGTFFAISSRCSSLLRCVSRLCEDTSPRLRTSLSCRAARLVQFISRPRWPSTFCVGFCFPLCSIGFVDWANGLAFACLVDDGRATCFDHLHRCSVDFHQRFPAWGHVLSPSPVYSALVWRHVHPLSVGVSQPVGRGFGSHLSLD